MAIYKRFVVQQKYYNGIPTGEYRYGAELDGKGYHTLANCEAGSECINLEFRWINVDGEVICEGTTAYQKQKRQQRCQNETEWVDIYPYVYQRGSKISDDSDECGYERYVIYNTQEGLGSVTIDPSKPKYNYYETVNITNTPEDGYSFHHYEYGSTAAYGSVMMDSSFVLETKNDWYIKTVFSIIPTYGTLYYSYTDGTESYVETSYPYVMGYSFSGSNAVIISDMSDYITHLGSIYWDAYLSSYIYSGGFRRNSNVKSLYFPALTMSGVEWWNSSYQRYYYTTCDEAFRGCANLETFIAPNLEGVTVSMFCDDSKLSNINIEGARYVEGVGFYGCSALPSISLPNCDYIYQRGFAYCSALSEIYIPVLTHFGTEAMMECTNLNSITTIASSIGKGCFYNCVNLKDVYLNSTAVVALSSASEYSPFKGCNYDLTIHVPCELVTKYIKQYGSYSVQMSNGEYRYYEDMFTCGVPVSELTYLHLSTDGHGTISADPVKTVYSAPDTVTITATPADSYVHMGYKYGSTSSYESGTTLNSVLSLQMATDWWVSAIFSYNQKALYYSYTTGSESYITSWSRSSLNRYDNDGLKATVISDGLGAITNLIDCAFLNCTALTEANFYNLVTLGESAFRSCGWLKTVSFSPLLISIPSYCFAECNRLTNIDLRNVQTIGAYAFMYDYSLSEIHLNNISTLSTYTFAHCTHLADVYLPSSTIVSFDTTTFNNCSADLKIYIPDSLAKDYLNEHGSYYVTLYSTVSPYEIKKLFRDIFVYNSVSSDCTIYYSYADGTESCYDYRESTIQKLNYNGSNAVIISDLSGVIKYLPSSAFEYCEYLEKVDMKAVSWISSRTFAYNTSLTDVSLPAYTSWVGYGAFSACYKLQNVNIGKARGIESECFRRCSELSSITLEVVSMIGYRAFDNCWNLRSVYLLSSSLVKFGISATDTKNIFSYCHSNLKLYVPASLYNEYWSSFSNSPIYVSLSGGYTAQFINLFRSIN